MTHDSMQPIMPLVPSPPIVPRDDGLFQIGIGDEAPGPFPSREFAHAVAAGITERKTK
jgi:hypothetical protein